MQTSGVVFLDVEDKDRGGIIGGVTGNCGENAEGSFARRLERKGVGVIVSAFNMVINTDDPPGCREMGKETKEAVN